MSRRPLYVPLFWLLVLVLGIAGFWHTGSLHGAYRLQYIGVTSLPPSEFIFYAWYGLFSTGVIAATAALVWLTPISDRAMALARRRRLVVWASAAFVLVAALAFRHWVLMGQPVADDELTYRFIAKTLLAGRVSNPPPIDPAFLWNQFVVAGPGGWYGKYPIGHPLFLAAGEAVGVRWLVVPLITAGCVVLTHSVGRAMFSDRVASLACVLLALSPQFVLTAGTDLSQPTEMLLMLTGMWFALRIETDARLRWAVLAGAAWGAAILVRPLPGALFLIAAAVAFCVSSWAADRRELRARLIQLAVAGLAALAVGSLVLVVNRLQTGGALDSGVSQLHGQLLPNWSGDVIAGSVAAGLLRQMYWLLGAPVLFVLVVLGRPSRGAVLLWGLIAAEYAYRVISPKTVVSTTGPIYMLEIVPLLALLTADGMFRAASLAERLGVVRARPWIASVVVAIAVASATMFLPVQLENIHGGATARTRLDRQLDRVGVTERSVVFANLIIEPGRLQSWAYYPENPSPDLSDDRIYLRLPRGDDRVERVRALWLERLGDRRAFVIDWDPQTPFMIELNR